MEMQYSSSLCFCFNVVFFHFNFVSEWLVNQHRDSAASYIGHYNLLDYFALVENETRARTRFNLLEVSVSVNPLTPMSDQDRISPYYIYTISCRQVMRIEKISILG